MSATTPQLAIELELSDHRPHIWSHRPHRMAISLKESNITSIRKAWIASCGLQAALPGCGAGVRVAIDEAEFDSDDEDWNPDEYSNEDESTNFQPSSIWAHVYPDNILFTVDEADVSEALSGTCAVLCEELAPLIQQQIQAEFQTAERVWPNNIPESDIEQIVKGYAEAMRMLSALTQDEPTPAQTPS